MPPVAKDVAAKRLLRTLAVSATVLVAATTASTTARADDTSVAPESSRNVLATDGVQTDHKKAVKELQHGLEAIWSSANLRRGTTAVYVVDAESGETLYHVHDSDGLNPASNVKLISTATVLATLGPNWRFQTRILGATPNAEGVVEGGLYLHGNYDPTLGPGALEQLALSLREQGVTRIVGDIVLGDSLTRDTLALSQVKVTVTGAAPGHPARIETWPASNFVQVAHNRTRSKKAGRSRVRVSSSLQEVEGQPQALELSLRGTIRQGHKRVLRVPVRRRSTFTASALQHALQDAGIAIDGGLRIASFPEFNEEEGRAGRIPFPLAVHESRTIASLVKRVNKRSLNHLSDRLVMSAARSVYGGPLDMGRAVDLMKSWLTSIGVDADSVVLDTGSGLSYQTELSTRQIVTVLRAAGGYLPVPGNPAAVQSFRESLALGGVDGTLRRRFRLPGAQVESQVRGKTGTLTRVIALSGFITRDDGRTLCFSIVTNGHQNSRKRTVRLEHEHMVAKLDSYLGEIQESAEAASEAAPALVPTVPMVAEAPADPLPTQDAATPAAPLEPSASADARDTP